MILSDRDLRQRLCDRSIVVEPLADLELQLQPASIDLRLGSQFRRAVKLSEELERPYVLSRAPSRLTRPCRAEETLPRWRALRRRRARAR